MANGNIEFEGQGLLYDGQPLTFLASGNGDGEEPSGNPTFGLPAETVALIESRFGTVANFLRLRNQGQV
jgi:hypothetical protein